MYKTSLRKVGGSVMLAVPPALLEVLDLKPGSSVGLTVTGGQLVLKPQARSRYRLEELLAKCNPKAKHTPQEREWLESKPLGAELI